MRVVLNGDDTQFDDGVTVRHVIDALALPAEGRGVAVAVDAEVVPRGQWESTILQEGARVEVLRAIQGG